MHVHYSVCVFSTGPLSQARKVLTTPKSLKPGEPLVLPLKCDKKRLSERRIEGKKNSQHFLSRKSTYEFLAKKHVDMFIRHREIRRALHPTYRITSNRKSKAKHLQPEMLFDHMLASPTVAICNGTRDPVVGQNSVAAVFCGWCVRPGRC